MRHAYAVAIVSDLHIGSTVALAPPKYVLPDGQTILASAGQLWVYDCWQTYWKEFSSIRADKKILIINGECCEGQHHANEQLAGQAEVMEAMAVEMLRVPRSKVGKLYVTRGSSAHSKSQGMSDETVARELGAERDPQTGWRSAYRWRLNVGKVIMDIAHHVTGSSVPWTAGNNVRRLVMENLLQAADRNEPAPHLIIRSHIHAASSWEYAKTRAFITPSWKLQDEYGSKIAPSSILPIGGLIITIDDGRANVITRTFRPNQIREVKV